MSYKLEFHPLAYQEYIAAYHWYEDKRKSLGERFEEQVEEALTLILLNPKLFPVKKKHYRETQVKIFPYSIAYQVFIKENLVYVSAIYHGKRNPKKKFRTRK